ncbi:MAG: hypothetical protein ABIN97_14325 [Ginsengibacter sp.]
MKRLIIFFVVVLIFGLLYLDLSYDYRNVLKFKDNNKNIVLADSFTIEPLIVIDAQNEVATYLYFKNITDTIIVKTLEVSFSNIDNPNDEIPILEVSAYTDTSTTEMYVKAKTFLTLPDYCKILTINHVPYKTIDFFFQPKNIDKTKFYDIKINGSIFYKGRIISFEKEIKAERKKEFVRSKWVC